MAHSAANDPATEKPSLVRPWSVPIDRRGWSKRGRKLAVEVNLVIDGNTLGSSQGVLQVRENRLIFMSRDLTLNLPNHPFRAKEGILECTMAGHRKLEVRLNGTIIMQVNIVALRENPGVTVVDMLRGWAASPKRSEDAILPPPITMKDPKPRRMWTSVEQSVLGIVMGAVAVGVGLFSPSSTIPLLVASGFLLTWFISRRRPETRDQLRKRVPTYTEVLSILEQAREHSDMADAPVRPSSGLAATASPASESEVRNTQEA